MKRIATAAAAAIALVIAVTATAIASPARSSGPPSSSPVADSLRGIERARLRALVDADMPVVAALLADDFQVIPPPGLPLSREDYLAALASGDIDYLEFKAISPIEVHLYGQAAVLTYMSNIDIVAAGLGRFTHDAWHTYLYEKRAGRWQVVWEQATAVGGFPPPTS
jgi:ketosteroid isomerase-like protein